MFERIVIKRSQRIASVLILGLVLVACGQKGPLEPQPMPEQNQQPDSVDEEDSE